MELENQTPMITKEYLFALDIGTRSVIGMVGIAEENGVLNIIASESEEYHTRAVVDGQIENISDTAKIVSIVKERLEKKIQSPLKNVYIAAAGRTLKTEHGTFEMSLDGEVADESFLVRLEAGAVSAARDTLFSDNKEDETAFFCTGHSVVRYQLDGYEMSTLLGHRGNTAYVDVIATFLPREVVESLYATMRRVGLTVSGLTLEPIATMNVIIPPDIRMLNLALADIGAGTSDIAVCNAGCVCAYTMATIAGDELTEAIMQEYLVDFDAAETIKRALSEESPTICFDNILGLNMEEQKEQILEKIEPVIHNLSSEICQRILESNGKAPSAVFLTGGGSQIPGLSKMVAEGLSIDEKRVAVGGSSYMKKKIISDYDVFGPEFATPAGIAMTAMAALGADPFVVIVNNEKLHLLNNWDMSVLDVLLLSGVKYSQIMGHVGKSISFELNGERRNVRGKLPEQASILLNKEPIMLSEIVHPGDAIDFQPAQAGADAAPTLSEIIPDWDCFTIRFNGIETPVGTVTTVNDEIVSADRVISNLDIIKYEEVITVEDLCNRMDTDPQMVVLNGYVVSGETRLQRGDEMYTSYHPKGIQQNKPASSKTIDEIPTESQSQSSAMQQVPQSTQDQTSKQTESEDESISQTPFRGDIHIKLNGKELLLHRREDGATHQFLELFNYVDIDPKKPQGNIILRLNGTEAAYLDPIFEGDQAEIFWENASTDLK